MMLSYFLNPLSGWMPWGTLASNAAGGLLIGAALAWTSANPELPPAVRLFVITGFLGGLTTFSTFSAEAFSLITSGAFIRAGVHMASHLLLSLTGTWAGCDGRPLALSTGRQPERSRPRRSCTRRGRFISALRES